MSWPNSTRTAAARRSPSPRAPGCCRGDGEPPVRRRPSRPDGLAGPATAMRVPGSTSGSRRTSAGDGRLEPEHTEQRLICLEMVRVQRGTYVLSEILRYLIVVTVALIVSLAVRLY